MNNIEWLDNIEIGLAILNEDGKFVKINPFLSELVGHTSEELENRHFQIITHPDDIEYNKKEFEKLVLKKSNRYSIVKRLITKNGDIIWVRVVTTPIKDSFLKQVLPIENAKEQIKKTNDKIEVVESVTVDYFFKKYWWRVFQIACIGIATIGGWVINAGMKMYTDSARIDRIEKELLIKLEKEKHENEKPHDSKTRPN